MCLPARARARVGRLSGPASSPECLSRLRGDGLLPLVFAGAGWCPLLATFRGTLSAVSRTLAGCFASLYF